MIVNREWEKIKELEQKIEKLKSCVEFYAEAQNANDTIQSDNGTDLYMVDSDDFELVEYTKPDGRTLEVYNIGRKARQVLKEIQ